MVWKLFIYETFIRLAETRLARNILDYLIDIAHVLTANLRTKIPDFRGFDSSMILSLRGGIQMPMGNFPRKIESTNLSRDNDNNNNNDNNDNSIDNDNANQ